MEIHIDLLKTTLKKYQTGKCQAMMVSGSRNSPPFSTDALEMTKCLQEAQLPDMDGQRRDHIDSKELKQRKRPKQLQIDNLPTDDVENINCTNKGRDLLLANKPQIVHWRTERMQQRIQRYSRITLHRSTHPKWEENQTEKSSYGLDWLKKRYMVWFCKAG